MRTERIAREIATVAEKYPGTCANDDPSGHIDLIVPELPIPVGFTSSTARIVVRIPALYPTEKLDLFWLTPALRRNDAGVLPNIMIEQVALAGEMWKQISWHDNSPHDPDRITVLGFVRGIRRWFEGQVAT